MNEDSLIKLTNELYEITLHFPKKGPLRYEMRELGIDILSQGVLLYGELSLSKKSQKRLLSEFKKNLKVLISFFEVARAQNWVSLEDILEVKGQYCKIGRELEEQVSERKVGKVISKKFFLKGRQNEILEILAEKKKAQIQDLEKLFPDISKRTLRRDLRGLLEQGLIERIGEGRGTFYKLWSEGRTSAQSSTL